jgi:hypothetical protein
VRVRELERKRIKKPIHDTAKYLTMQRHSDGLAGIKGLHETNPVPHFLEGRFGTLCLIAGGLGCCRQKSPQAP